MPQSGARVVTAGIANQDVQSFVSGEVDFITLDWRYVFSAEGISASGVTAFATWYTPANVTGFLSGTGGPSAMWLKVSAVGAHNPNSAYLISARVLSTSAKEFREVFYARVHTGLL